MVRDRIRLLIAPGFILLFFLSCLPKPATHGEKISGSESGLNAASNPSHRSEYRNPSDFSYLYHDSKGAPRDEITVGVIDSGYGGLSVVADMAEKFKAARSFKKVNFVFYNAFFSRELSYGDLTREERPKVLSAVLTALATKEKPDVILLACNTLSVFYYETEYSKSPLVPTIEIVEPATTLMQTELSSNPGASLIYFATPVTVRYGKYSENLQGLGFDLDRVVPVSCGKLAGTIESGSSDTETRKVVAECVSRGMDKAREQGVRNSEFVVSLNCTHYTYASKAFEAVFGNASNGIKFSKLVSPNSTMSDPIFIPKFSGRNQDLKTIKVVIKSHLSISSGQRDGLGKFVNSISPETYQAMEEPIVDPELFDWESIADERPKKSS